MNKHTWSIGYLLLLTLLIPGEASADDKHLHPTDHPLAESHVYYTCSMHPSIRESKPGRCPICQMMLTRIEVNDSVEDNTEDIDNDETLDPREVVAQVKLKKSQMTHFKPSIFPAQKMKMRKKVRLLGAVLQAESRQSFIPARVEGRIENVFISSTGSFVQKGQPVVEIYSPKLITTGEEYILSRKSYEKNPTSEFRSLMDEARNRLILWGINKSQYERWYKEGRVSRKITLFSPETGIVAKKLATVGRYVKEGQNLFELYDLSELWVEMDVYEHDAAIVKQGQKVELEFTAIPGKTIKGQIDFIDPILSKKSRTLKIRTTISNPEGHLKPGMVADATLLVVLDQERLIIPRTAIIDTGKRKVVWIKVQEDSYIARSVRTGFESEGYIEVIEGLEIDEPVVIEGNFLLDSQAQLFGGYEDLPEPAQP